VEALSHGFPKILITIVSTSKDVLIVENYCFSSHVKDPPNVQPTKLFPLISLTLTLFSMVFKKNKKKSSKIQKGLLYRCQTIYKFFKQCKEMQPCSSSV
jgi:hypothetical protein